MNMRHVSLSAATVNMRHVSLSAAMVNMKQVILAPIGTAMSSKVQCTAGRGAGTLPCVLGLKCSVPGAGGNPASRRRSTTAWADGSAERPVDGLNVAKLKRLSAEQ